VSEAVSNALIHGYGESTGRVQMVVEVSADEFVVTVSDRGGGLAPRSDSPGLGLGLSIIAQLTRALRVDSPPGGGTSLRMTFPRA
jgi:serine/threonine-protein kinase RsbW